MNSPYHPQPYATKSGCFVVGVKKQRWLLETQNKRFFLLSKKWDFFMFYFFFVGLERRLSCILGGGIFLGHPITLIVSLLVHRKCGSHGHSAGDPGGGS